MFLWAVDFQLAFFYDIGHETESRGVGTFFKIDVGRFENHSRRAHGSHYYKLGDFYVFFVYFFFINSILHCMLCETIWSLSPSENINYVHHAGLK